MAASLRGFAGGGYAGRPGLFCRAISATYVFAGNDGLLAPAGVEKLADGYRDQLERVQKAKEEKLARA